MSQHSGKRRAAAPLPGNLDREKHLDLADREIDPWIRRLIVLGIALIPVAALLGAFGQRPSTETAHVTAGSASLTLDAPTRLRGGLIFQAKIQVEAGDRPISEPVLALADGWLDSVTLNAISPLPTDESSSDDTVLWTYDRLEAGENLTIWTQWQVNPTRVGTGDGNLELRDGDQHLAGLDRTVLFFP